MYTFESRIRYSEVDAAGGLKLTSLIDYLQDCSTFQSEDVGYGLQWLSDHGFIWVVNAWQVEIARLPRLGERVTVGTNPYDIHGFIGLRNFFMDDAEGNRLVVANSVWSFLDLNTNAAARAPEEMKEAYGLGEKLPMEYLGRKLPFPEDGETVRADSFEVRAEHLDTNLHVNNGQYIRLATEQAFAGTVPEITRIRAEYKKQAHLGDVFCPRINRRSADGGMLVTVCFSDEADETWCTVEFTCAHGAEGAV